MHPTLRRFLDRSALNAALHKADSGSTTEPDERALALAATDLPEEAATLRAEADREPPTPEFQEALLAVAFRAAVHAARTHPSLAAPYATVLERVRALGGEAEDADGFLAMLLAEEGFGDEASPDAFDEGLVVEGLHGVPALLELDQPQVERLLADFAQGQAERGPILAEQVGSSLLEAAWTEGPAPITAEHLEEALEELSERLAEPDRAPAVALLRRFLEHLASLGLVGPQRRARLEGALEREAEAFVAAGREG
jgi:hypothetical protein